MTNEANFFHSLQSWSRNLGILATEVQSLSNYASRKSEHFEGYDVAMRCLQRIIIHDYALASLLSSSSNQPVTTTSLSALLEACSTLVTSGIM
ncbi:hypothetical protein EON65_25365 [archaeon]|nr:MAG: hypothetical protein EON65_25365 [archaeon]